MEQRLANAWRMSVNEKIFIETALLSDLRVDGRRPFDYRLLNIQFGREDGSAEVQLGQTHVMGFVTAQLVQPYRDRPNEGTLSIYTEFSPMADPSFEAGRPGEFAVELGRIIDRGLRESRALDTESLCVVAGKLVWAIRVDLHILDNGGNLVDAANIAALVALSTFRLPEYTIAGEDIQDVIIHPLDVGDPQPLRLHHLPIAITFGFLGDKSIVVIDPTYIEEAVMGGRITATLNTNGAICSIQKGGGVGVMQSVIMQCLRIASVKVSDITTKIKKSVELYNAGRALQKNKYIKKGIDTMVEHHVERLKLAPNGSDASHDMEVERQSPEQDRTNRRKGHLRGVTGGPSSWDPYSKGVNSDALKASLALRGTSTPIMMQEESTSVKQSESEPDQVLALVNPRPPDDKVGTGEQTNVKKTLKDAVKPKHKRKRKPSSNIDVS